MKWPFEDLGAMVDRMTPRERRLFGVLAALVAVFVVGAAWAGVAALFGSIREETEHGRKVLAELAELAPRYRELAETRRQIEEAIRNNKTSVRVAANEILKRMELSDPVPGATGDKLSDIVSFEGKTTDTPVDFGKKQPKKGAKGKAATGGIVEIEQNLEFRDVPVANLVAFLDSVEQSKDLLFVTKLDVARKFNDRSHVRAVITIATFQYQGEEASPAAPTSGEAP